MNVLPVESISLPHGETAVLRPVTPADIEAEREFVASLSANARYYRFHGTLNGLTDARVRELTCVDQARHVALVATIVEGDRERLIADARYVAQGEVAEFAVAVSDRYQGCGVARRLLAALGACARRSGLRWLVGEVLATNRPMLGLAQRLGFARSAGEVAGVVRVERSVDTDIPAGSALTRVLGPLRRWLAVRNQARQMFVPF